MDGLRASQVIDTVRAMFRKDGEEKVLLDVNNVVRKVFGLLRSELHARAVLHVRFWHFCDIARQSPDVRFRRFRGRAQHSA